MNQQIKFHLKVKEDQKEEMFKGTPKNLKMDVQNVLLIVTEIEIFLRAWKAILMCVFSTLLLKLYFCCDLLEIMLNTSLLTGLVMLMLCQM